MQFLRDPLCLRGHCCQQELGSYHRFIPHIDSRGLPKQLGKPEHLSCGRARHCRPMLHTTNIPLVTRSLFLSCLSLLPFCVNLLYNSNNMSWYRQTSFVQAYRELLGKLWCLLLRRSFDMRPCLPRIQSYLFLSVLILSL